MLVTKSFALNFIEITFIFRMQISQGDHLMPFCRYLHHVVGAVLATAHKCHDPHGC